MALLSIVTWGGIGDTLRNLSLVPHEWLHRRLGQQCDVSYVHWRRSGAHPYALPPEPEFFQELVGRCCSLRWVGEVERHRGFGRMLNRGLRDLTRLAHGGEAHYFPFSLPLTDAERRGLPDLGKRSTVAIQTHLNGMKTKQWGLARWQETIGRLRNEYPGLQLLLMDAAPEVRQLCIGPEILSTYGLSIFQSIALLDHVDVLVSIDSWSKYVGAWKNIPQVVVVPDQRSEYPGLTAERLTREEFSGIWKNPRNRVLGLEGTRRRPKLTLPSLSNLSADTLLNAVRPMIQTYGKDLARSA